MIVLITGDREWEGDDPKKPYYLQSRMLMLSFLRTLPKGTVIREGCARGADHAAEDLGTQLGFTIDHWPADWERKGKQAGPLRNREMYWCKRDGWVKPDLVAAFHNHIEKSKGTKDMIEIAEQFGTEVKMFVVPEARGS